MLSAGACAVTVVATGVLLQPVVQAGSPPSVTLAVLLALPAIVGATLMVIVTEPSICRLALATLQVTVWLLMEQFGVAEMIVIPTGTTSVTLASAVASASPMFRTEML